MEFKRIIFLMTVLLFLMGAPAMPGRSLLAMDTPAEHIQIHQSTGFERKSVFMAQNNSQATDDETRKTDEKEDQASKSGTAATDNKKIKSSDSASKPLKPFKPSEEIAAEQAVDFPVDI